MIHILTCNPRFASNFTGQSMILELKWLTSYCTSNANLQLSSSNSTPCEIPTSYATWYDSNHGTKTSGDHGFLNYCPENR